MTSDTTIKLTRLLIEDANTNSKRNAISYANMQGQMMDRMSGGKDHELKAKLQALGSYIEV